MQLLFKWPEDYYCGRQSERVAAVEAKFPKISLSLPLLRHLYVCFELNGSALLDDVKVRAETKLPAVKVPL